MKKLLSLALLAVAGYVIYQQAENSKAEQELWTQATSEQIQATVFPPGNQLNWQSTAFARQGLGVRVPYSPQLSVGSFTTYALILIKKGFKNRLETHLKEKS